MDNLLLKDPSITRKFSFYKFILNLFMIIIAFFPSKLNESMN